MSEAEPFAKVEGSGIRFGKRWAFFHDVFTEGLAADINEHFASHIRAHYVRKEDYDAMVKNAIEQEDGWASEVARLKRELEEAKARIVCSECGGTDMVCFKGWEKDRTNLWKELEEARDLCHQTELAWGDEKKERDRLKAALEAVMSQCAGHSDEFSGNVWRIANKALKEPGK